MNEFGDLTHQEFLDRLSPLSDSEVQSVTSSMPLVCFLV